MWHRNQLDRSPIRTTKLYQICHNLSSPLIDVNTERSERDRWGCRLLMIVDNYLLWINVWCAENPSRVFSHIPWMIFCFWLGKSVCGQWCNRETIAEKCRDLIEDICTIQRSWSFWLISLWAGHLVVTIFEVHLWLFSPSGFVWCGVKEWQQCMDGVF